MRIESDTGHIGNAEGDPFALVVTAFPHSSAMQGNGYDKVDIVEKSRLAKFFGIQLSQVTGTLFPVVVFDVMEEAAIFGVWGGVEECKGSVYIGFPPK